MPQSVTLSLSLFLSIEWKNYSALNPSSGIYQQLVRIIIIYLVNEVAIELSNENRMRELVLDVVGYSLDDSFIIIDSIIFLFNLERLFLALFDGVVVLSA